MWTVADVALLMPRGGALSATAHPIGEAHRPAEPRGLLGWLRGERARAGAAARARDVAAVRAQRSADPTPRVATATPVEVRWMLDQAAAFSRAGDVTAAVSRAKRAVRAAPDEGLRAEAAIMLQRYLEQDRAWRMRIDAREERHRDREQERAGIEASEEGAACPRVGWLSLR